MSEKAFDKSKFKTEKEFREAWKKLCDLTPTKEDTCKRIRENQELFLEYQQKCLYEFDPDLQQAIEHSGDIIRELAQCGYSYCDRPYIEEKMMRLRRRIDDLIKRGVLKG